MKRWMALMVIGLLVVSGIQGCVLVVGDEDIAHEIREDKHRSHLARDIQRDLAHDSGLERSELDVTERDGVVRLRGEVDGLSSLSRAIAIAVDRDGVRDLKLDLEVALAN